MVGAVKNVVRGRKNVVRAFKNVAHGRKNVVHGIKSVANAFKNGIPSKETWGTRLIVYGYGYKNEAPKEENEARDAVFGYLSKIKKLVFYFG